MSEQYCPARNVVIVGPEGGPGYVVPSSEAVCDIGCTGPELRRVKFGKFTLPHLFDVEVCPRGYDVGLATDSSFLGFKVTDSSTLQTP